MNGWNTILSYWDGLFSGALAVSFREGRIFEAPQPVDFRMRNCELLKQKLPEIVFLDIGISTNGPTDSQIIST